MKIASLKISNYRNLDGINISFAEDCNFIVGDNNIGKSNLLSLFNTIFNFKSFRDDDFKDLDKAIKIDFCLRLSPVEIGHFGDNFDIEDESKINIVAKQENIDESINFFHLETDTYISPSAIRTVNFVHYDSLRSPLVEVNFDKGKGVGKFLRSIITQYLTKNEITDLDFLNQDKTTELLNSVNNKVSKLKVFSDFGINASSDDDVENLLTKILTLKDGKGDKFQKAGHGVQCLVLITLSILEKLQSIVERKSDKGVFENDENGNKSMSLILGLDEPEIHLHPYMQRSLIKYVNSIISNTNADFRELVKELFDIDEFNGQILVTTHSPNIVLNDYKQIVRFYLDANSPKVVSGSNLAIDDKLLNHLYLCFPLMKEAFFSNCAIFVEGVSEVASLPIFARKISIDLDDFGISIIAANGDAVPQLMKLASFFGIPSVGLNDKDDGTRTSQPPDYFLTSSRDFDDEIVSLIDLEKEATLRSIVCSFDSQGENSEYDMNTLNKYAYKKYGICPTKFTTGLRLSNILTSNIMELKSFYLTWFSKKKGFPLGLLIGETLSKDEIPQIFKDVIERARKKVLNEPIETEPHA